MILKNTCGFINNIFIILFICLILIVNVQCAPAFTQKFGSQKMLDFMKKYGYIVDDNGQSEALYTETGISDIIKNVQKFGGLEQTGVINNDTLKLMASPRCGVPDIIRNKDNRRKKRFNLGSDGWSRRNLSYYIANWSPRLSEYTVVKNIQKALDKWAAYGHLRFSRTADSNNADIIVAFGRGYHGDVFPFDGPGQVLAHAFFPIEGTDLGGDIHFDDDEKWADRRDINSPEDSTDFYTVALHELGHSLGLAHSAVATSIMFPYYKGYDDKNDIELDYDDILAMYKLYISRNTDIENEIPPYEETTKSFITSSTTEYHWTRRPQGTTTTNLPKETTSSGVVIYEGDDESVEVHKNHDKTHKIPENNSPSLPNICNGHFDAVATLRGELFIFKDQYVWRLKRMGHIEQGYPITLHRMFPKLPAHVKNIDAAYENQEGIITLFAGRFVWFYDGRKFMETSPQSLQYFGLPHYLDSIDAVQRWKRNDKVYFYKGNQFWKYNETARVMDDGYPLHIEKWRGVPENLDSATTWVDGITYFFKGDKFWKFDNDWVIVTENSPFPTAPIWIGCNETESMMRRFFG